MRLKIWLFVPLLLVALPVRAEPVGVYKHSVEMPLDQAYRALYSALEANQFWVVFEADMGSRMAAMAERWGEDYNRQGLEAIKSMVFCNIGWTNRIAGIDPGLLSLCPLHMSLYQKDGVTTITMLRPTAVAVGSPGIGAATELEQALIGVIDQAFPGE